MSPRGQGIQVPNNHRAHCPISTVLPAIYPQPHRADGKAVLSLLHWVTQSVCLSSLSQRPVPPCEPLPLAGSPSLRGNSERAMRTSQPGVCGWRWVRKALDTIRRLGVSHHPAPTDLSVLQAFTDAKSAEQLFPRRQSCIGTPRGHSLRG